VVHGCDVVIVEVETLEEGLGEQAPGRLTGHVEQLLRLVEKAQRGSRCVGTLGQVVLDRLELAAEALLLLLQQGHSGAYLADGQRALSGEVDQLFLGGA